MVQRYGIIELFSTIKSDRSFSVFGKDIPTWYPIQFHRRKISFDLKQAIKQS